MPNINGWNSDSLDDLRQSPHRTRYAYLAVIALVDNASNCPVSFTAAVTTDDDYYKHFSGLAEDHFPHFMDIWVFQSETEALDARDAMLLATQQYQTYPPGAAAWASPAKGVSGYITSHERTAYDPDRCVLGSLDDPATVPVNVFETPFITQSFFDDLAIRTLRVRYGDRDCSTDIGRIMDHCLPDDLRDREGNHLTITRAEEYAMGLIWGWGVGFEHMQERWLETAS